MARIQVLSTPGCAGCAQAKGLITRVLEDFPGSGLDWEEIDLTEQPDLAGKYGIMSVPAVVIDEKLEFTRVPKEEELRERIKRLVEGGERGRGSEGSRGHRSYGHHLWARGVSTRSWGR